MKEKPNISQEIYNGLGNPVRTFNHRNGLVYSNYTKGRCGGVKKVVIEDGTYEIGELTFWNEKSIEEFVLPNSIKVIGHSAFSECPSLKSLRLPDGLEVIEYDLFSNNPALESVYIGRNVRDISASAFLGCPSLHEVVIDSENPQFVVYNGAIYTKDKKAIIRCFINDDEKYEIAEETEIICTDCFTDCDFKEIIIPHGLKRIDRKGFFRCSSLRRIILPENMGCVEELACLNCHELAEIIISGEIKRLPQSAFACCNGLKAVIITGKKTAWDAGTFIDCGSLETITISDCNELYVDLDGVIYSKDRKKLIFVPRTFSGTFEIPCDVESIGICSFEGCKVENVFVSESVKSIEECAFFNCYNLIKVHAVGGLRRICDCAFENCILLSELDGFNDIAEMGKDAFKNCRKIECFDFPKGMTKISESAFRGCEALRNISLPSSITLIEDYAFAGCEKLHDVEIPDNVTEIGDGAFYGCGSLYKVTLPKGLKKIGKKVFGSCRGLQKFRCYLTAEQMGLETASWADTFILADDEPLVIYAPKAIISEMRKQVQSSLCAGFAEMVIVGEQVDEAVISDARKYIYDNRKDLYRKSIFFPYLLKYMIEERIIPMDEIDNIMELARKYEKVDLLSMLIKYKNGNMDDDEYNI